MHKLHRHTVTVQKNPNTPANCATQDTQRKIEKKYASTEGNLRCPTYTGIVKFRLG